MRGLRRHLAHLGRTRAHLGTEGAHSSCRGFPGAVMGTPGLADLVRASARTRRTHLAEHYLVC